MAITRSFSPAYTLGLAMMPMEEAPEAASQTYTEGAVLVPSLTSATPNGNVVQAGTNPGLGTKAGILGVAIEEGKNTSAGVGMAKYVPAIPSVVFEGQVYHSSAASAVIAAADRFAVYGITQSSANWVVDKTKSTIASTGTAKVRVIGFKDALATLNGVVFFQFLTETSYLGTEIA